MLKASFLSIDFPNISKLLPVHKKNFLFSIGKVWKVDKIYIIVSILLNIISAISVYTYSYTLKVAIDAIENNDIEDKNAKKYIRKVVRGIKENETQIEKIISEKLVLR